jgi:hypothetical protein
VGADILIYPYLTVTRPPEAEAAQPMGAKFLKNSKILLNKIYKFI